MNTKNNSTALIFESSHNLSPNLKIVGCHTMRNHTKKRLKTSGFMMVELVIVILLLAMVIGPMVTSLFQSLNAMAAQQRIIVMTSKAMGTLNRVTGLDYSTLKTHMGTPVNLTNLLGSSAAATQEDLRFNGQDFPPVVNIIDASGGAGGLIEISVTLDNIIFQTLKAKP
jgi:hypothetical protein